MVIGATAMSSTERLRVAGGIARFEDDVHVQGDLLLTDQDGTPVADRHLRVIDGRILATTTGNVEGRYISNDSIEVMDIADGGTGQTAKTAAFDALAPTTTKGDLIAFDGSDNVRLPVGTNGQVLQSDSTATEGVSWTTLGAGKIVQIGGYSVDVTDRSTTNTIPLDDTIPQTTEMGTTGATVTYTPTSADTVTYIIAIAHIGSNVNNSTKSVGIYRSAPAKGNNNIDSIATNNFATATLMTNSIAMFRYDHADTSSQTWDLYFGGNTGTTYLNRRSAGALWGDTFKTTLLVLEVDES